MVTRIEAGLADILEIKLGRRAVDRVRTPVIVCYRGKKRQMEKVT